ncbi:hypothetical protein GIW81_01505 [Hyphomicrobium sp. xq]|uniref:Secreted protein n=1 Tax=Hyphomicrobium album TaxID=2665159 RepID=A0A6I3KDR3_9HYPH|nr:hypothetical protein [Hyphomicrobium album]MTD93004.1 hypothetical protein [Hyphomicrobium album]
MRRLFVVLCLADALLQVGGFATSAEEVECTRYVAAVGKIVRVPCDDGGAPGAGAQSDRTPAMHFTPAELDKVAPLRSQLTQLADALRSAEGDRVFRDSFCTAVSMAQLVQGTRSRRERKKLFDETIVMQAKLGDRGRLLSAALTKPVTDPLLDTAVNEASGSRLRHTPEGMSFISVRDRFQLNCSCLRDRRPPKRLVCCDNCGLGELKARLQADQTGAR